MASHLNEMKKFIVLSGQEFLYEDQIILPELEDIEPKDNNLLQSLDDLIFKMISYQENTGSSDYKLGVEQGLNIAADMIANLLDFYKN